VWPSGSPYPHGELPWSSKDHLIGAGLDALGYRTEMTPHAIATGPINGRSACMNYGFCIDGCKSDAKGSINVSYLPHAVAAGAEIRPTCFATRVDTERGAASGVTYLHEGEELFQPADRVFVCCYAIETPRLLLNSASSLFPDGLANSSGLVGKCFMVHSGHQVFARFSERIGQYKAPPPGGALTEHFNRTMPDEGFACGYTIEVVGPHPVDFAARMATARGLWGAELRRAMFDYNYYSGVGIVGEILPQARNVVKLHETERDQYGLPVPHVRFGYHDNDRRIIRHATDKMREILEAAGGEDVWSADRTAHLLGTCRMGDDPSDSVVNRDCRAHDVPNLYICDGSVFPTSTAVNPSLTIQAIAARAADHLIRTAP
jgi:choline dehydrogenase-like flavoprotein